MKKILLSLLVACSLFSNSQQIIGRQAVIPLVQNSSGGTVLSLVWTPQTYANTYRKYPLIIFLHGWGDGGTTTAELQSKLANNTNLLSGKIAAGWNGDAVNPLTGVPDTFIVITPQHPTYAWNYGNLKYLIPDMIAKYRVDINKIYITGLSAGGEGTWGSVGNGDLAYINRIAAIVPVATTGVDIINGLTPQQVEANFVHVTKDYGIHVWSFVGEDDPQLSNSLKYHDLVMSPGGFSPPAKLTVVQGIDHSGASWGLAYNKLFRPVNSYKGSNAKGAYVRIPNSLGSGVEGTGITQDSLNIFEWMLMWSKAPTMTVDAGPDQTITLPTNSVSVSGSSVPASGHTIASYQWTKQSGPASFAFANSTKAITTITGLTQGSYVFRLTATDDASTSAFDDIMVIVNAANPPPGVNNSAPTVFASPTLATVVLPNSIQNFSSTSTDPDGDATVIVKYWTKLFRPGQPLYKIGFMGSSTTEGAGAANYHNTFVNRIKGYYSDLGIIDSSLSLNIGKGATNVMYGVGRSFVSPGAHPGATVDTLCVRFLLSHGCNVIIVNYPSNGYDLLTIPEVLAAWQWIYDTCASVGVPCYITGTQPRTADFDIPTQQKLQILNDSARNRFTAHFLDFFLPISNANDYTVQTQYSAGDGLHLNDVGHGVVANVVIAKNIFQDLVISSTGITTPDKPNMQATGLTPGVHIYNIGVYDQYGMAAYATAQVTVSGTPTNHPPTANAGSDQIIQLPATSILLSGSTSHDDDGTIASYLWTKVQGLGGTFDNATLASPTFSGLTKGPYLFKLQVTDNSGSTDIAYTKVTVLAAPCSGVKRILPQTAEGAITYNGNVNLVNPGDILALSATTGLSWSYANLSNIHGTPGCPVTITNDGGNIRMINGILLDSCTYIKISGNGAGTVGAYGIWIEDTAAIPGGPGIAVEMKSRVVEIDSVHIHKKQYGILIKNEANCVTGVNSWVLDSMNVHDNSITNMQSEGMYLGSTDPDNCCRPVTCGGVDFFYKPSQLSNFTIYNNIVDSCGRPGIQLSNCRSGQNEIYNNRVTNIGTQFDAAQGNGISLGGYSRAHIFNNHLDSTYTDGIASNGSGIIIIEGNFIGHPGVIFTHTNATVQAIFVHTATTSPVDSVYWTIKNNLVDASTGTPTRSIYVSDDHGTHGYNNYICGNTKISGGAAVIDASNSAADPPFNVPIHYYSNTCSAPSNQAPTANAGPDQSIQLPTNAVTVSGVNSFDVDGGITAYAWSKISGPVTFTIASPTLVQTSITGLVQGVYTFRLTVTDNGALTGTDDIIITVLQAANVLPSANAGPVKVITLPTTSIFTVGSGSDADGSIASYLWTKFSGPNPSTITGGTTTTPTFSNLVAGTYVFQLLVTDDRGGQATDTMTVFVNQPPLANAGTNQTITLPTSSVTLSGSGSDVDGSITTYAWVKTSGGAGTITSASSSSTSVTGLAAGNYVFTLTVTDNNGATASNPMQVVVNAAPPANISPIANAGPDLNITLPTVQVTIAGSSSDPDGSVASISWAKTAGPAQFTIVNGNTNTPTFKDFVVGTYDVTMTVTDNLGAVTTDVMRLFVASAPNLNSTRIILYNKRGIKFQ